MLVDWTATVAEKLTGYWPNKPPGAAGAIVTHLVTQPQSECPETMSRVGGSRSCCLPQFLECRFNPVRHPRPVPVSPVSRRMRA